MIKLFTRISPAQIVLLSFFFTILLGTFFLMLPMAQKEPLALFDVLFTATSATCVTGLFTIPLTKFTLFGHAIILLLIQIGGLGLITMTLFFMSLIIDLGLGTHLLAGQVLEIETGRRLKHILLVTVLITFITELFGTIGYFFIFKNLYSPFYALFLSLFQSISAFCNSGISLLSDQSDLFLSSYAMLSLTGLLIFIGGLGFVVWQELFEWLVSFKHERRHHFSLHTKIVLYGSISFVLATALIFWILEQDLVLTQSYSFSIVASLFNAISLRSSGFSMYPLYSLQLATILLIMVISFIGSAPGSTGSGVKITTFIVFLSAVKAAVLGKTHVEIKGRRIPIEQVFKATAIVVVSFAWVILTTFLLLIIEPSFSFIELLYESFTSFTTLGYESGVTQQLSVLGKLFVMLNMLIGRIGSFTLILALKFRSKKETAKFAFPEERVMLG